MKKNEKKFLVNSVNINGNLIDCNGKELEAGLQMFVISEEDNTLYIGKKIRGTRHHTSFLAGKPVKAAGMMLFNDKGKLLSIIARSGHYQPEESHMFRIIELLLTMCANLKDLAVVYDDKKDLKFKLNDKQANSLQCWISLKQKFKT